MEGGRDSFVAHSYTAAVVETDAELEPAVYRTAEEAITGVMRSAYPVVGRLARSGFREHGQAFRWAYHRHKDMTAAVAATRAPPGPAAEQTRRSGDSGEARGALSWYGLAHAGGLCDVRATREEILAVRDMYVKNMGWTPESFLDVITFGDEGSARSMLTVCRNMELEARTARTTQHVATSAPGPSADAESHERAAESAAEPRADGGKTSKVRASRDKKKAKTEA
jgi:hypothetical protein